jgi:anthranilate synthase
VLRKINPSPYGFLFNLGGEYLIGASPEMFVRVEGRRIETSPISGTIARGRNAIEDAERIRTLLNSEKDEAELTMCTDVDRNDKARVCEPGTVTVIGRRQIELYSHLIHTVDHVEGLLRPDCDAFDAFLTHCWAVTVTGAPKRAAVAYIEAHESMPRRWYGGAVGRVTFDGNLNTGLTLRTIRLADEVAEVRAGATLLFDSDPDSEERETHLKAAAMRRALAMVAEPPKPKQAAAAGDARPTPRVLMVDCEDSFVLTLADYLRQTGADLMTLRHGLAGKALDEKDWDLIVLSPGPGRPEQFGVPDLVRRAVAKRLPVFGVCLGLQGIVEAFGGRLGTLPVPYHGKSSLVQVTDPKSGLFKGLPESFPVGRYHSLYAAPDVLPDVLSVTARTEDGVIMAVEHKTLPVWGVQFHPESIMSLGQAIGPGIIANVVSGLAGRVKTPAA